MFDFILKISSRSVHLLRRRYNEKSSWFALKEEEINLSWLLSYNEFIRFRRVFPISWCSFALEKKSFALSLSFSSILLIRCHNNYDASILASEMRREDKTSMKEEIIQRRFSVFVELRLSNAKAKRNQSLRSSREKISFRISISMMAGSRYRKWKYLLRSATREYVSVIKFTFDRSTSDNWICLAAKHCKCHAFDADTKWLESFFSSNQRR